MCPGGSGSLCWELRREPGKTRNIIKISWKMQNREKLGGCLFLCLLLRVNPGFTSSGGKLLWLVTNMPGLCWISQTLAQPGNFI